MTTIQDIIASDTIAIFGVEANTPLSAQAVYTPKGGSAEDAVTVFYSNNPLHGDALKPGSVEEEVIAVVGQASDVSGWQLDGTVTINSTDFEVAEESRPKDSYWSIVMLRRPHLNETLI